MYKHVYMRSIFPASSGRKNHTPSGRLKLDTGDSYRGSMQHLLRT